MTENRKHAKAREYLGAGLSIIPIRADGSKSPATPSWKPYTDHPPTDQEVAQWFAKSTLGIGIVCGAISGGIEVLDFDAPGVFEKWKELVEEQEPGLIDTLPVVQTPSGYGRHVYVKRQKPARGRILARGIKKQVFVEIRGEGHYVLAPGCPPECHSARRTYEHVSGPSIESLRSSSPIKNDSYQVLISAAQALNEHVSDHHQSKTSNTEANKKNRPGDRFNKESEWEDVLEPHGWKCLKREGVKKYWRRPGKNGPGISATTGYCRSEVTGDLLFVFSTNAHPFESGRTFSKFTAFTLLNHDGDFSKAAKVVTSRDSIDSSDTINDPLSPLSALHEDSDLPEIEKALRDMSSVISGLDPLRLTVLREQAIRKFKRFKKISSPAALVDSALGSREGGTTNPPDQGKPMSFADPEPWSEKVDGISLLKELQSTLCDYLVLPNHASVAISLWIVHAHAHDAAFISPFLSVTSPERQCGKTRLLELLSVLVPRPLTASNISSAGIFRVVEKYRPTLLIDEMDTFIKQNEELRGILNSGHSKPSAFVVRTAGDHHEPRYFSTWAPKAIAKIGALPSTLEDRSIVIGLRRRKQDEEVKPLRLDGLREFESLCRRAGRWVKDNIELLKECDPTIPDGLNDRAADNWRALLAIADTVGGGWPDLARAAALALSGKSMLENESTGILLLQDIREIFKMKKKTRLKSSDIVNALAMKEEHPWPELHRGDPITPRQLADLLKPFKIQPKPMRFSSRAGKKTRRGYTRASFNDAFSRYLRPEA